MLAKVAVCLQQLTENGRRHGALAHASGTQVVEHEMHILNISSEGCTAARHCRPPAMQTLSPRLDTLWLLARDTGFVPLYLLCWPSAACPHAAGSGRLQSHDPADSCRPAFQVVRRHWVAVEQHRRSVF